MADTPDRCPLCGGRSKPTIRNSWVCDECDLPERHWPRVAQLVAIRDAVIQWQAMCELDAPGTCTEIWAQESAIMEMARQEVERGNT